VVVVGFLRLLLSGALVAVVMVAIVVTVARIVGGCACIVMARNGLFVAFTKLLLSEEFKH